MLTQSGWHALGDTGLSAFSIRATMNSARMRIVAGAVCAAALLFAAQPAPAQNADAKPADPRASAPDKDGQRKPDEFTEAARLLGGPAAFPECVWLGRRVVSLLWRDDLDTAFRHLDLYDRFSCPSGHIQATFRCLVRQGNPDPKALEKLEGRVHACWINPTGDATAAGPTPAAPSAAAPSGTTNR
jgi:hypothetical protein